MSTKEELEQENSALKIDNSALMVELEKAESVAHEATVAAANAAQNAADAKRYAESMVKAVESKDSDVRFSPVWLYPPNSGEGIVCTSVAMYDRHIKKGWYDAPNVSNEPVAEKDGDG